MSEISLPKAQFIHAVNTNSERAAACQMAAGLLSGVMTWRPEPALSAGGARLTYKKKKTAGSPTCSTLSPSLPPRPTSFQGSQPQHGVHPYRFRGCSTPPLCAQQSPLAAKLGGRPLLLYSFERGWGMSSKGSRTVDSEPSPGHTKPHQYEASRQKWAFPLCLSTWMAGRPNFA